MGQVIVAGAEPPAYPLTEGQLKSLDDIVAWFRDTRLPGYVLSGYAGTGKTYLTRLLARSIRAAICMCAPTNKAVGVLQQNDPLAECCTIYSLLGLQMKQVEDKLVLTKAERSKDNRYSLVILDEASMVNEELFSYIQASMANGTRYLFVGDPKQLNPVGEHRSKIWKAGFPRSRLTQVVRHDNEILNLATHIRKVKRPRQLRLRSAHANMEGVWKLSGRGFYERVERHAERGYFDNGESKCVAWRNKTVDELNSIIRRVQFGAEASKKQEFLPGDRLVFTAPYEVSKYDKIHTDDEAKVVEVIRHKHTDYDFDCDYLTLDMDGKQRIVKTIHRDDRERVMTHLNELANEARTKDKAKWREFWALKESVCYVKHGNALTGHRAQGSTYKNVFLDVPDILSNSNEDEALRCLYVGATRPSHKLFIS